MKKEIVINNKDIELISQSGKIIGLNKYNIQNINSYSGGSVIINGSGYVSSPRIVTSNNTIIEFFLKTANKEMPVKLINYDVSLRDGHNVTLLWGSAIENTETMFLLSLINHDTNNKYNMVTNDTIQKLKLVGKVTNISFIVGFILFLIPFGVFLLIFLLLRNSVIRGKSLKIIEKLNSETFKVSKDYNNEFLEKVNLI